MKRITFLSRIPTATPFYLLALIVILPLYALRAQGLEVDGWQSGFQTIGPDRAVFAAIEYDGGLVVGGDFRCMGDLPAEHAALWNGSSWSALGAGVEGPVNAMCIYKGKLVVAGSFWHAGGSPAGCIATWDGSTWGTLGSGFDGTTFALAVAGDRLVVGGSFTTAGGHPANYIANWDGSSWTAMGDGMNAPVRALAFNAGVLYAGGEFSSAGGVGASHIASFNGLGWSPLGDGADGNIYALRTPFMGKLIAGGSFETAGGSPAANLAVWNGTTWSALGANGTVYALGADANGFLLVGGDFTHVWNADAQNIARIGIMAAPLPGGGTDGVVYAVGAYGDQIVAGGSFQHVGDADVLAPLLAVNDPGTSTWSRLGCETGNGIIGDVTAMIPFDGGLVVAGDHAIFGQLTGEPVAMWTSAGWSSLGLGEVAPDIYPGSLYVYAGQLILGCGDETAPLRLWNWSSWLELGGGVSHGEPIALHQHGNHLIVGGYLEGVGPTEFNDIASWDGDTWDPLGGGVDGGSVSAMATYQGDLCAGGSFTTAGGSSIRALARWDGTTWHQMAGGIGSGWVNSMAVFNGELIVGGSFALAKGGGSKHLARRNGSTWTTIETTATSIRDLVVCDAGLAVLCVEDNESVVKLWDGSSWAPLASDIDQDAYHLAFYDDALWLGGRFSKVGGMASANIAAWRGPATPVQIALRGEDSDGAALLSWEAPTDVDPAAFRVERRENASAVWIDLATAGLDRHARSYLDTTVEAGRTYEYRIQVIGAGGNVESVGTTVVAIEMPTALSLSASPNPNAGPIQLRLGLPGGDHVVLAIYDVGGREVARPWEGSLTPGTHGVTWDGCDRSGHPVPAGRYFARLRGCGGSAVAPILRMR